MKHVLAPALFSLLLAHFQSTTERWPSPRRRRPPRRRRRRPSPPRRSSSGSTSATIIVLANYQQLKGYWEKLGRESDRIKVVSIGNDRGRPAAARGDRHLAGQPSQLDRYREIARRLALADGVDQAEARTAGRRGQGGRLDRRRHPRHGDALPAGADRGRLPVPRRQRRGDAPHPRRRDHPVRPRQPRRPRPRRRLVHAREGPEEAVARPACRGSTRSTSATTTTATSTPTPRPRRKNMNRFMYREWFPQVMYNHHQAGPPGTVLFCPPFRDPFNYFCDPLVINGIDAVGAAMVQRFLVEGQAGGHHPIRRPVLDLVQRRPPHDHLVPQHHRPADRDHRQPDADADPARGGEATAQGRLPRPDRAAAPGISASRSSTR